MHLNYNQWFGNRLREILEENQMKVTDLAARSGINRMTISRILQGRYATATEVQKIADALGITVNRLKQKDVDLGLVKTSLYRVIQDLQAEVQEALYNVSVALGATEKGLALETLGALYTRNHDYSRAMEAFEDSYRILKDSKDPELEFRAFRSYTNSLIISKQFDAIEKNYEAFRAERSTVSREEDVFYIRQLNHYAAVFTLHLKKYELAISIFDEILQFYKKQKDRYMMTVMLNNAGDACFYKGDYVRAKSYYDEWYHHEPEQTVRTRYYYLSYCRDYAKILYAAGAKEQAVQVLEKVLPEIESFHAPELLGHCYVLLALLKNCQEYAKKALKIECDETTRLMASVIVYFSSSLQEGLPALQSFLVHSFALE